MISSARSYPYGIHLIEKSGTLLEEQDMKPQKYEAVPNTPVRDEPLTFERRASCVPPDVPKNTRILSLLSISQYAASPEIDGWFISDFFIESGEYHELTKTADNTNLRAKFVMLLEEHLKAASENGENLLVMIFGHGQETTGHLVCGDRGRPFTVKNLIRKFKDVPDVPVMLAKSSIAVFRESPGSLKRASGSMFVSAVVKALTSNPTANKSLKEEVEDMEDDEDIREFSGLSDQQLDEQAESYAEFTGTTYEALASIDRRAYE
ncbi:hypothetical protein LZ554_007727 [Drepanopeziza brunnea f. sp. 'monogermtubi']|nr:hypothetical protein LZ554_007727 [Drepanopeziza brunnea f. sp. 'monogermtubi']